MSQFFQFSIAAEDAGQRLDEFLASRFGGLSRMRLANLIKAGACTINQIAMPAGWRLNAGDEINLTLDDAPPTAMEPEAAPLDILHEDEQIIVVVKPAGLLVHPNKGVKSGTLANRLAYHLNRDYYGVAANQRAPAHGQARQLVRPGLIHRLDRATSGVMVVAKTQRALSQLSRHFNRRLVEKRYLALVEGALAEDAGQWQAPIDRQSDRQPHWWITEGGKPSVTNFTVRERLNNATFLELEPVTGRTNQLRIHAAYFGYPMIGDDIYGSAKPDDENNDSPSTAHNLQPATRLCLHAWRLAFYHPLTGDWLEFTAPLPVDFVQIVDAQRVENPPAKS